MAPPTELDEAARLRADQARLRRQARRISWLWSSAVPLAGLPLSAVLTPLLYLAVVVVARLAGALLPVPERLLDALDAAAALVPGAVEALFAADVDLALAGLRLLEAVPTLLPGLVAMAILAWRLQAVIGRIGAEIVCSRLDARPADATSPDEAVVVDELTALCERAGVTRVQVRILDRPYPNGTVLATRDGEGTVLLTRGLVEGFEPLERRGALALLVTALGNGDGRLALVSIAVFQAFGLVLTALETFLNFSATAWRDLRLAVYALLRGRTPQGAAAERLLELGAPRQDGLTGLLHDAGAERPRTRGGRLLRRFPPLWLVLLPPLGLTLALVVVRFALAILRLLVVEPLVMLAWRARRYRADAMAARLADEPDAVARALARLEDEGTAPGGAAWSDLFLVGSEAVTARAQAQLHAAMELARQQKAPQGPRWQQMVGDLEAQRHASRRYLDTLVVAEAETPSWRVFGPRPPLARRLRRLRALGASLGGLATRAERRQRGIGALLTLLLVVAIAPPAALVVGLTLLLGSVAAMLVAGSGMRLVEILLVRALGG
jgi:Zn-dependent protease with chaperone function